jgi:4-amino-4-deoxy-L-arabinose transferase-like glycosyltransferase
MNAVKAFQASLQSRLTHFLRAAAWPVIAVFLIAVAYFYGQYLIGESMRSPFDFDAKAYYIPYAKRLLNEGFSFLFTEDAIHIPPFSFIFPALFGADLGIQKSVSIVLSTLNILILFRTGQLLHSRLAGIAAVIFYASSPSFKPFLSTGSVEPLFIFLMASWFWLLAEAWASQRRSLFLVAGAMFGLAALTRATVIYVLPIVILASFWMRYRTVSSAGAERANWTNLAWAHVLALAMILPFLIKNIVMFDLPSISTGAGIALYLGNHPLTFGMDSGYFRTNFDNGIVPPPGLSHLALVADRALAAVGKYMLLSQSPSFLLEMYAQKLFAFFFVGNREWVAPVATLRSWRIFFIAFSIPAVWALRARPIIWILCGLLVFQVAAHLPVVYSHRYSVGVLETSLVLFAGIGVAMFVHEKRWFSLAGMAILATMLSYVGAIYARDAHRLKANIYGVPHEVIYSAKGAGLPVVNFVGAIRLGDGEFESTETSVKIDIDLITVRNIRSHGNEMIAIEGSINADSQSPSCEAVNYYFRKQGETVFSEGNVWQDIWPANGKSALYVLGSEAPLEIYEPGTLRLQFTCGAKMRISLSRIEVVRPTVAQYYREQYLKSTGATDWSHLATKKHQ